MSMSSKRKIAVAAVTVGLLALGGGALQLGRQKLRNVQFDCTVQPYEPETGEQRIVIDFDEGKRLTLAVKPGTPLREGPCTLHFAIWAKLGVPLENLFEAVFSDRIGQDLKIVSREVSDRLGP